MFSASETATPGELLRYYREKNGVSKKELGDELGITEYGVINLEKGFNTIHYKEAVIAGHFLNIDPEILLDDYSRFCIPGYGKKIKTIRTACGVSQIEFAKLMGVNRCTVSIWEVEFNGLHPSRAAYEKLMKMAHLKGVDINDTSGTENLVNKRTSKR